MIHKKVQLLVQGVYYDAVILDKLIAVSTTKDPDGSVVLTDQFLIEVVQCYPNEASGMTVEMCAMMEGAVFTVEPSAICKIIPEEIPVREFINIPTSENVTMLKPVDKVKKTDMETVMHFVSKTEDRFRKAFGKRTSTWLIIFSAVMAILAFALISMRLMSI